MKASTSQIFLKPSAYSPCVSVLNQEEAHHHLNHVQSRSTEAQQRNADLLEKIYSYTQENATLSITL